MTDQSLTTSGAVAVAKPRIPYHPLVQERFGIDQAAWRALVDAVWPTAKTTEGVILALSYCRARNLDPFKRPVHIVPVWNSAAGREVETVWPGINELRTTAARTKSYAGCDPCTFGPDRTRRFEGTVGRGQNQRRVEVEVTFPEWAQMTVYRMVGGQRVPFPGPRVYWLETYATIGKSEVPNEMWQTRPRGQLEKCFDPETEVLTDRGFERFDSVTGRVLQVTDHGLEPTDAVPFRQAWNGPMIHADGEALNFSVTPNHDMITTVGKIEADDLFAQSTSAAKFRIPLCVPAATAEAPFCDRTLQIAAAYLCDGYDASKTESFVVSVSRPRKIEMLNAIGLYTSRTVRPAAGSMIYAGARQIVTRHDKTIFRYPLALIAGLVERGKRINPAAILGLSARQARLFVDAMLFFDGNTSTNGTRRFYSSRPDLLGAVELAAVIAGYAVSPRKVRKSDIGGPNWCITIARKSDLPVIRYSEAQIERHTTGIRAAHAGIQWMPENQSGEVWCVRVPSGVIVVRRHGLSMLCGNCTEAAALRRAFPEELGGELIGDEVGHRMRDITPPQPAAKPASRLAAFEESHDDGQGAEPVSSEEDAPPPTAADAAGAEDAAPAEAGDRDAGTAEEGAAGFDLTDTTGEVLDTIAHPQVYAMQLGNLIEGAATAEEASALVDVNMPQIDRLTDEPKQLLRAALKQRKAAKQARSAAP